MGKILDIQNRSIDNTQVIIRQVASDKSVSDNVTKANFSSYNTSVIHAFDTDWYDFNLELDDEGVGDLLTQFISFETIFESFDEKLIPFISVVLIYQQVGETDDETLPLSTSANFFEVEDIEDSDLKQVKITSSFFIPNVPSFNIPNQGKLLVSVYNPTDFWRIH